MKSEEMPTIEPKIFPEVGERIRLELARSSPGTYAWCAELVEAANAMESAIHCLASDATDRIRGPCLKRNRPIPRSAMLTNQSARVTDRDMKSKTNAAATAADPTAAQFAAYRAQYDYFNRVLFGGKLAPVILNFSRAAKALGFFAPNRWGKGALSTHEISLNPSYLALRPAKETASTLVHEMAHAWQQEYGKPGRGNYHNAEWAAKMKEIGLQPTATGEAGGPETGDGMTHLIVDGGPFCRAFDAMSDECRLPWSSFERDASNAKRKPSKVKFTCPGCGCNAWGKPTLSLCCGDCSEQMEPAKLGEADDAEQAA